MIGSVAVNLPSADVGGATTAEFAGDVTSASAVTVQSTSANTATASADVFSLGGIGSGAGVSADASVTSGASTEALVDSTSSISAAGAAIQVLATSVNHATANATGDTLAGLLAVSIELPSATVGGLTKANFDGGLGAASLNVTTVTSNLATAKTHAVALSFGVGVAGADADATIDSSAVGEASIGSDASITVSGAVTVDSHQSAANHAVATIDGDSSGIVDAAVFSSEAHVGGSVLAEVDGAVDAGGSLSVTATGTNLADATTNFFGIGGAGFSGSGTYAQITSQAAVTAKVGSSAHVQNDVSVTANATNTATATSDSASGGIIGSVAVNEPTAEVGGATLAEFDGDVTNGTAVSISATSKNDAEASSKIFSLGGLGSGAGASVKATITSGASTTAQVGQASSMDAPGVVIQESATSANTANAVANGGSGSLGISVVIMIPTALVGGPTTATFDGDITHAAGLQIQTHTANDAEAHSSVVGIGLIGSITGADPDAEVTSSAGNTASIGQHATIDVGGAVSVSAAQTSANTATAKATGGSGGFIDGGVYSSDALVGGPMTAEMDGNVTANTLSVSANGANTANATTTAFGIGGLIHFNASGTFARISSDAGTSAQVGSTAVISTTGTTMVTSTSANQATASSDSAGGSLLGSMTVELPTAKVDGPTYAGFDGAVTQSGDITISATSANNVSATTNAFSIGLLASVAVGSSDAEVTSGATTDADVGSSASITAHGSDVSVTATGANTANATAENTGGGLLAFSAMLPTAKTGGAVTAEFDGSLDAGSLAVQAFGENTPTATASVETISLAGAAGAFAEADVTSDAATNATVGGSAHIATTGAITVHSQLHDSKNAAVASALGLSGALFASISVMGSKAEVDAPVSARIDGTVTASGSIDVEADGGNDAGANTDVSGLTFGFAGAGAGAGTVIGNTADTNAVVGGNVTTSGLLHVKAIGNNSAHTTSSAATVGFVGVGISLPTASVAGGTLAEFDGTATGAGAITIEAGSTNTASSHAQVVAIGLFAGAGASASANVTGDASTDANVGASALINSPAAVITVSSASGNLASAVAGSAAGGVIAVGDANPTAEDDGETGVSFLGSVHGASASDPGAAGLTVQAIGTDASQATVDSGQGGAISVDTSTATATTNSTANGAFGNGSSIITVSGNIHFGVEDDVDADSSSHGDSGGLVKISSFHSHANMTSVVTLNVGGGAQITAGGSIDINATNNKPPDPISDGTFDASSQVDPGANTITFTFRHALETGDIVTYEDKGNSPIGGLTNGAQYAVIVPTGNLFSIQLGSTFSSALVDPATDTIAFGVHAPGATVTATSNLHDGDHVFYITPSGSSTVGGLVSGTLYTVKVIDPETIKLIDPSETLHSASTVDPKADITGGNTINESNNFADGDNVTYHAPGSAATFSSSDVDVDELTSPSPPHDVDNSGNPLNDSSANDIFFRSPPGFSSGEAVVYDSGGGAGIGLSNGGIYYVIKVDDNVIQLAATYCDAVGTAGDPGTCPADQPDVLPPHPDLDPHPVTPIHLTPDKSTSGIGFAQSLTLVQNMPIPGLTDSGVYYVVGATGSSFQVATTQGGTPIGLGTSYGGFDLTGPNHFAVESVDLTSKGSGAQDLVIDITSASSGTQLMDGIGGPSHLVSAPSGDRITTASSSGSGGGIIDVGSSDATASDNETTNLTVNGGAVLNAGGNLSVTTNTLVNDTASGQNGGGGLVSVGQASATAGGKSTGTLTVAGGAQLTAGGDLTVDGTTNVDVTSIAASSNVGLGSGVNTHTATTLSFANTTTVDGSLTAGGTLTVAADSNTDGQASSDSNAGGLGADANSDAHVTINSSTTEVDLQGDAQLKGTDVEVKALGDNLTANAHAHTHATALGAGSDADGETSITATALVLLEAGSSIIGDATVTIKADDTVNLTAVGDASCSCFGGDTNSTANITDSDVSKVDGRYGAYIKTAGFEVDADEFIPNPNWNRSTPNDGAVFDGGGTHGSSNLNAEREIFWEAHVVLAPRSPVVIVDSSGTITALVNATVRSFDPNTLALSGPLAIGDTIPVGDWISVDDLVNSGGGAGSFNANDPGSHDGATAPNGVIWGNHALMEIQQTWSTVTIKNDSNRTLETHGIEVASNSSVELDIHVDTIPGPDGSTDDVSLDPSTPGGTFEFDIKHTFPPTLITISNKLPGHVAAPDTNDVVLDGTIDNPIGTTTLENETGNILAGPDNPGKVVRTNILVIDADAGSAGLLAPSRAPIAVELVWSQYTDDTGTHERPIALHADVALDLVLDITSILREVPAGTFSPSLGPIHAGRNVDLAINDSVFGTDVDPLNGSLAVGLFDPPSGTPSPNPPDTYKNHFRPDTVIVPDPNEDVLRAFGHNRTNLDSAYTFSDLSAGNNIHVFHNSTATTITFTAFTNVDATLNDLDTGAPVSTEDHIGRIDLLTNGSIVDTETSSDLRVGSIDSTNGDVTLKSPAAVLDAESGAGMLGTDPTTTDVTGRNITIVAGNNGIGGDSGRGGVGMPADFLEINVDADGGALGVLAVTDTQAARAAWSDASLPVATTTNNLAASAGTFGVFLTETTGDMKIARILTNGDASLDTVAGSIVDARNAGAGDNTALGLANVVANNIDLAANGGSIGASVTPDATGDDLKIDSSNLVTGRLAAQADIGVFLTETVGRTQRRARCGR